VVLRTRTPGRIQAQVRLTAFGRRLLRQSGHQQLTATATFVPSGHRGASLSQVIGLRH
jgi:hypothetical protein